MVATIVWLYLFRVISMKNNISFMESETIVDEFIHVFFSIYYTKEEELNLNGFPYWNRDWSAHLNGKVPFLLGGCFLNTSSYLPEKTKLVGRIESLKNNEVILLPNIRNFSKEQWMSCYSFEEIKCGYEFIYKVPENDFDAKMRERIGNKNFRELKRLHRRSYDISEIEIVPLDDLCANKTLMSAIDLIFLEHEVSY